MTLISERGFVGVPEVDNSERNALRKKLNHETALYMQSLVPHNSIYFYSYEGLGFEYAFSASVRYESPITPGVVIDAFLSRDVNSDVTLHIAHADAIEGEEVTSEVKDAESLLHETKNMICTKQEYGSDRLTLYGKDNHGYNNPLPNSTIEQCLSVDQSINEVLDAIALANEEMYGTSMPGVAGRSGNPTLEALAGYALVPFGRVWQGRYSRGMHIPRSELSEELLTALDSRKGTDPFEAESQDIVYSKGQNA